MSSDERMFLDVLTRIATSLEAIRVEIAKIGSYNRMESVQKIKESKERIRNDRKRLVVETSKAKTTVNVV